MARRVDQVQLVLDAVFRLVIHARRLELDGNATLALEFHRVQKLVLHLALLDRIRDFQKTIGQRAFAVIDMGDDAEISDALLIHVARRLAEKT
jgi:hypothetical protein